MTNGGVPRKRFWLRRILWTVGALVLGLMVVVAATVGYGAVQSQRAVELPPPPGDHAVGRATMEWTDGTRTDPTADDDQRRTVAQWIWYPAVANTGEPAAYAPEEWDTLHPPAPVGWFVTDFDKIATHAQVDATPTDGRFPVVILMPGLGFSTPQYQGLAEGLASSGHIVVSPTPTHSSTSVVGGRVVDPTAAGGLPTEGTNEQIAPDADRLLETWAADARYAASHLDDLPAGLAERIDAGKVIYVGHSFGGAAALAACTQDDACVGAVDIDGYQFGVSSSPGLTTPYLLIGADGSCSIPTCTPTNDEQRDERDVAQSVISKATGPGWVASIASTQHLGFTDYASYRVTQPIRSALEIGGAGPAAVTTTARLLDAFVKIAFAGGQGDLELNPAPADLTIQRVP
ncbi:alpha/beta fold hydrolase [Prescottella defluvii]|nr:alpha/beta fold hydrolase [Prescottella defluvii]